MPHWRNLEVIQLCNGTHLADKQMLDNDLNATTITRKPHVLIKFYSPSSTYSDPLHLTEKKSPILYSNKLCYHHQ